MKNKHVIGVFDSEENLVNAINALNENKINIEEIYTPYPVHEAIHGMGQKSRFTWVAFFLGLVGAIVVLAFLYYTSVIDWPLNFGGKPSSAFPSFIIITIVTTILIITIGSLFTFSVRAKIYPGKEAILPDERSTDDKFVMMFRKEHDTEQLRKLLQENGVEEINEKEL